MNSSLADDCSTSSLPVWRAKAWKSRIEPGSVATTFSTDTPNLVTNMVRENGVADNWLWWSFLLTGMMTVFFFAKLWRRSRVMTDLEFYELRYSGKAATFVRGFRALYLGLFFNCVIMATVNLAAAKIGNIVLGLPMWQTLLYASIITIFFASVSGLWGVLVTDSIQFLITMSSTFAVAYFALQQPEVGGLAGLMAKVPASRLNLLPDFSNNWNVALSVMIIPITIQWGALPPGVLMSTGTLWGTVPYTTVRANLVQWTDPTDVLPAFLPAGPTLPVRFDGTTTTVTNVANVQCGAPWLMANFNSRIVRRSNALFGHDYGRHFRYSEEMFMPGGRLGFVPGLAFTVGMPLGLSLFAIPATRKILASKLPAPGEGPTKEERERGRFALRFLGRFEGDEQPTVSLRVTGRGDPGYLATSRMMAQSALSLACDPVPPGFEGGVLTPATAMGMPLVERLRTVEMTFDLEPIRRG